MKRLLSLFLVVVMLFAALAMVACGDEPVETTESTTESTKASTTESTKATETTTESKKVETTTESKPVETTTESKPVETTTESKEPETTTESSATEATTIAAGTTLGIYARFDYGTKSKAQDLGMTSHEYLVAHLKYNEKYLNISYDEDNIIIYACVDYDYATMGPAKTDIEKNSSNQYISSVSASYANYMLDYVDLLNDYTFEEGQQDLLWGWGSWSNYPYQVTSVGKSWVGRHQYMQARFINGSANTKWSAQFASTGCGFANTTIGVFDNVDQGKAEFSYKTYQVKTWDMAYCFGNSAGTPEATPENGVTPSGNWGWHGNEPVIGLRFHVLGSYCSAYCRGNKWATGISDYDHGDKYVPRYGNDGKLINDYYLVDTDLDGIPDTNPMTGKAPGETIEGYEINGALINFDKDLTWKAGDSQGQSGSYSLTMQARYDTRGLIKAGNFVIIDYILFGASIEGLNEWTSYIEDAAK